MKSDRVGWAKRDFPVMHREQLALSIPSIFRRSMCRDLQVKMLRIASQLFSQNVNGSQNVSRGSVFRGLDFRLRADLDRTGPTSCDLF
ncbi:hypothetical protein Q5Y75_22990 [Ruegeria sp. 2205SS24-7]|uniref:hypothetical protein n=1 Tax=Ruegeria discodermiae TaxID=3064389 RepID=UPI002741B2A3|nr:hypothetical protein [Ruegeria sp. 2205SS24-7]MDP5220075.1 hypothetical protein [Ruegeria sp. 2205SS24-7]